MDRFENIKDQDFRNLVHRIIEYSSSTPEDDDYPVISKEFRNYYTTQLNVSGFPPIIRINIYANEAESQRVVIIGDLHSDFNALSAILTKLSLSSYDYFENGLFIFTGDYTDRGCRPVETLRLLYALKSCLGERCIMLKGNHELMRFEDGLLSPMIYPSDTYMIFNWKLGPAVSRLYADYCARLPYAAVLNFYNPDIHPSDAEQLPSSASPLMPEKRFLICHASLPRFDFASFFDETKLAGNTLPADFRSPEGKMLNQMIWGDPVEFVNPLNKYDIRFEFGKKEFNEFMEKNGYDLLIRSHEFVKNGFRYSFDKRLITIFSSGGEQNDDSFYCGEVPNPSFAIINENGLIEFESVFEDKEWVYNLRIKDNPSL
jgi:hypothetical protein